MQSSEIIELEEFGFNHYLHHFEESDEAMLSFEASYVCIAAAASVIEEIIWN
ncbi:MAG: hypothetical protein JXK05_05460 [Campylobacterales bacterium]|nr:hypothetical protein [Campylobacterales bacterium]